MYIATITIKTADGFILPGEPVKGLSRAELKELLADGYIVDERKAQPKPENPRTARTRKPEPTPDPIDDPIDEDIDDGHDEGPDVSDGLPADINPDLR